MEDILASLSELGTSLEQILAFAEGTVSVVLAISKIIAGIVSIVTVLGTVITTIVGALGTVVTTLIAAAILLVTALIIVLYWFIQSLEVYVLAKKLNYRLAPLAWIPVFGRAYVLVMMVGNKPFQLFGGRITIKSRLLAFLILLAVEFFGEALITTLISVLFMIPYAGQIASMFATLLYLVPYVVIGFMDFVFLRDILERFEEEPKTCRVAAIILAVLDNTVTGGLAHTVYLFFLMFKKPVPQMIVEQE